MAEKQHLYELLIVKKYYHYVYVYADSLDEAEDFVTDNTLNDPDFDLDSYYDDEECEVIGLDRIKTGYEIHKPLNQGLGSQER